MSAPCVSLGSFNENIDKHDNFLRTKISVEHTFLRYTNFLWSKMEKKNGDFFNFITHTDARGISGVDVLIIITA